ncbi:MAG: putative baseplate assembly protein, partial [Chloroflexi bacterium]|nr:putative baseplate assembly protein [Chloroflexota bacterium]
MQPPAIDPRKFQDLVDEAKRRIPLYCPEWTDHNVSDPGVMLIELFAWMVDILLYRLNEVPERDFLKFLELIGVKPRPAVPATAELLFWLTAPSTGVREIRRGIEVATRQTETRQAVVFTTDAALTIREPNLR